MRSLRSTRPTYVVRDFEAACDGPGEGLSVAENPFHEYKINFVVVAAASPPPASSAGLYFAKRGIENIIIMGVHTNRCVLGRPFGIRQIAYLGKNVVLCRDLTDSYHRDPGKHFEGLDLIVQHVEKYWCPTITSDNIAGGPVFRFNQD